MKNTVSFIIIFSLLSSFQLAAQQRPISSVLSERNMILKDYLNGNITENSALNKITTSHAYFRKNNRLDLAYEEGIYKGILFFYAKRNEQAYSALKSGLTIIQGKNDTLEFKYTSLIAKIYALENEVSKAQTYFEKCYEQILKKENLKFEIPLELGAFLTNYASFLSDIQETELRKSVLEEALQISKQINEPDLRGYVEAELGSYYIDRKNSIKAALMLQEAIIHTDKPFNRLPRLLNLADLYATQNRWNDFNKTLLAAKRDYNQVKNVSTENIQYGVQINLLESQYLLSQNRKTQAIAKAKEAASLALLYGTKSAFLAKANITLGDLSEPATAQNYYIAAIDAVMKGKTDSNFSNVLFPREFMEAMRKRAAVESPPQAMKTYEAAIAFSSQTRKSFTNEESKYFYDEELRPLFGKALATAAGSKLPASVFDFIEQSKAAVLSEALQDRRIKYGNVSADLLTEERVLQRKLMALQTAIAKETTKDEVVAKQVQELKIKRNFLKKNIEKSSPEYFRLKYGNKSLTAKQIQLQLDKSTALLSYFKSDLTLYVSVITSEHIQFETVVLSPDYQQCMDLFRKTLYSNPGFGRYEGSKAAQCLYGYLIKPVEPFIKDKKRLLVIRDAELNLLPFEVLEAAPKKYLLSRYIISYNYAASLAFTDSKKNAKNTKTISFAPYTKQSVLNNKARDRSLGTLPFSNNEVTEIGGNIYRDKTATKQQFLENYRSNGIIHFATHAQIDDIDPTKSFIAFYPDSSDYKLYTNELYNLSMQDTRLVVLSACEAGRGKIQGGEGMLSLARGFAYAGCPAVITTLWNAHDKSSAYLAERLHYHLKKGLMKDEALQQAKLDFMSDEIGQELNHPYYWANFILIGDASALHSPTNWWLWGSLTLGLLLLLVFLKKKLV